MLGVWLGSVTGFVAYSHIAASLKMGFELDLDESSTLGNEQIEETTTDCHFQVLTNLVASFTLILSLSNVSSTRAGTVCFFNNRVPGAGCSACHTIGAQ